MQSYKVENLHTGAPIGDIRIKGDAGQLIDNFLFGRVFSDYAREVVYREAEDAFKNQIDDETPINIWQGEFWGKWMISAARAARYKDSDELREFIRKGAYSMLAYQRSDGYLGTYKNSAKVFLPSEEEVFAATGSRTRINWNIWCRKYTLWGMLECYMLLGDAELLDSARRMADQLIAELGSLGAHILDTGSFEGVASGSILKPMLILYRLTEDRRYLDFCTDYTRRWEDSSVKPALIANSLSGERIREWYPLSDKWAKAYETMSCFDGLLELYRITAEEKYLASAKAYYEILIKYEYNILSSVGFNDVFGDASCDLNTATEPCDVIHFMRFSYELFLLTGEAKYMDLFELAASTPLLASVFKGGRWGARALRGQSRHLVAVTQAKMQHNHCCVNNLPRGLINIAEAALTTDNKSIFVNLYLPSEGKITLGGDTVKVKIEGEYLSDAKASITLDFPSEPKTVMLRIPEWSSRSLVIADGVSFTPESGYFAYTPKSVHSEIRVAFDDEIKVIEVCSDPERGDIEWKRRRWISEGFGGSGVEYASADPELFIGGKACILRRGATLLCRSKLIGNTEEEMFGERLLTPEFKCVECKRVYSRADVSTELELVFSDGKRELRYHVCDYATGTNLMTEDKRFFSIYF